MTVGETLSEARYQAGLSVEELSERTRIRGTVIRSIEQDDFEACGGDLYVHGYVRAIAGAVGIDAQPLIREYDLGRADGVNGSIGWRAYGYPSMVPGAEQTSFDLPAISPDLSVAPEASAAEETSAAAEALPAQEAPGPPADPNMTRYDIPVVPADPAVTSYDLPRVPKADPAGELPAADFPAGGYPSGEFPAASPVTPPDAAPVTPPDASLTRFDMTAVPGEHSQAPLEDLMAVGYDLDLAAKQADANDGTRIRKRRGIFAVAAAGTAVVVVAAVVLGIHFATGNGSAAATDASTNVPGATGAVSAAASASAAARASASAGARANASAAAKAAPLARQVTSLRVASVKAFGPDGAQDGDDPGDAGNVIGAHPVRPWSTQWYATAEFGLLRHGTGLLLDLGDQVTVTTVRLDLSRFRGADLQLRVGNGDTLRDLQVAATANDVGGPLTLRVDHPVTARYLLIWITLLPPNGAGKFQETVSHVSVTGRR